MLIPSRDSELTKPVLRHPDLQPHNIFVSETFEVTGLIDWQHCSILPLLIEAGIPQYSQNFSDKDQSLLNTPSLPAHLEDLDEEHQAAELDIFQKRQLHFFYMAATARLNKVHFDALADDFSFLRPKIYHYATNPWEGDNVALKTALIETTRNWEGICTSLEDKLHCPITFTEEEIDENERWAAHLAEADAQMTQTEQLLGVGAEGWVPSEYFAQSKELATDLKTSALEDAVSETVRLQISSALAF